METEEEFLSELWHLQAMSVSRPCLWSTEDEFLLRFLALLFLLIRDVVILRAVGRLVWGFFFCDLINSLVNNVDRN